MNKDKMLSILKLVSVLILILVFANKLITGLPETTTEVFNIPLEDKSEGKSEWKSEWVGKKAITLGTSISWQDGKEYGNPVYSENKGQIARGYQTHLREKLGIIVDNHGVSGSRVVGTGGTQELCETLNYEDVDLVILEIGTNDFKLNSPLGSKGNLDLSTFYGSYRYIVEDILTANPNILIVLLTPLQRDNDGYDVNKENEYGHKLIDYVGVIKEIGEMYSLPVCDLYSNSGISQLTLSSLTMDGLHPNDVGYERMGNYIVSFLK